jgi:hypothetical protein
MRFNGVLGGGGANIRFNGLPRCNNEIYLTVHVTPIFSNVKILFKNVPCRPQVAIIFFKKWIVQFTFN